MKPDQTPAPAGGPPPTEPVFDLASRTWLCPCGGRRVLQMREALARIVCDCCGRQLQP